MPRSTSPAKRPRETWPQKRLTDLLVRFHEDRDGAFTDVERAKLIELKLLAKPEPVVLTDEQRRDIDDTLRLHFDCEWPQRTLAIRHAIERLREMLPKRSANASAP